MPETGSQTLDRTEGGQSAAPDAVLSFSIETFREAGASLGVIKSSLPPPRTTFEDLSQRAHELQERVLERERRSHLDSATDQRVVDDAERVRAAL